VERTRVAALAALVVVLSVGGVVFAAGTNLALAPLAAVTWPVSTLLVSEVQTGGASASDEFAEITNVGASAVDLAGLELVYATSTGSSVTRKASWPTTLLLEQGRHLLIANTSGIYAGLADATYSGGFAATGGAIVLRAIGGAPVDAIGWGDATNAFVEGAPMAAPAAGSSIERKPGGLAGNATDTNANATDWFSQASPNPQSLAAPPVPAPAASGTPTPTAAPTVAPTQTSTPASTPSPTDTPAPTASAVPSPSASAEPTAVPTVEPTAAPTPEATIAATPWPTVEPTPTADPTASPTFSPTLPPTPEPTAIPTPTSLSIADARGLVDGSTVTIVGVLTTPLGALESARKGFVQDDTAGIAVYLDVAVTDVLPTGALVMATGMLDDRFAERTLRVNLADVTQLGEQVLPTPLSGTTGAIREVVEGSRVLVHGVTVGASTELADGLGLMVDDGSGQVRVIVGSAALGGATVPGGTTVVAVGPVGQRDSSGTGLAGYRIHVTEAGDFQVLPSETPTPAPSASSAPTPSPSGATSPTPAPAPSPAPTPSAAPSPTPAPTPTATPGRTPAPTATPGPTPPPTVDVVEARGAPVGTVLTVAGVVTAEAGRLGIPPLIAIADGTGGIAVRLPDGVSPPARGTKVLVRGTLAGPYGQLELRPANIGFTVTGQGSLPAPTHLTAAQLGEATEGRLAELVGTVTAAPRKSTSGDLAIDLVDAAGTAFRVIADGSSRIAAGDLAKDHAYRLVGIVGQRASRKGALDGYRLYLRDRGDITAQAASSGPGAGASPGASGAPSRTVPVSTALAVPDGTVVTIEAVVTAGANLLDSSGRRLVVQDSTGAIEVLLPNGASAPAVGSKVRVTGETGLAWGAPRIAASAMQLTGGGTAVTPAALHRPPAERDEWLLVRLSGTVAKVERMGERWRAEITLADGTKAPIQGQAGAGIPSTAIVTGRRVTVTGIVRRPYPTASDRRFALLPRGRADLAVGPDGQGEATGNAGVGVGGGIGGNAPASSTPDAVTPDTDLATIADLVGKRVRVGGLIERVAEAGFDLDDGTALARIELRGAMADLVPLLRQGEAIAATGTVELVDGAPVVVVDETGTLVRVGTLGEAVPIGATGAQPTASAGIGSGALAADAGGGIGGGPAPASLFALLGLTALSVLATILRRRLLRRRLRVALIDRLATLRSGPSEHESA
jgi:hypothetical protein